MGVGQEKGQQYHPSGHIYEVVNSLVWLEYEDKEKEVWPQMKESIHFQTKEYGFYFVVWWIPLQVCGKGMSHRT